MLLMVESHPILHEPLRSVCPCPLHRSNRAGRWFLSGGSGIVPNRVSCRTSSGLIESATFRQGLSFRRVLFRPTGRPSGIPSTHSVSYFFSLLSYVKSLMFSSVCGWNLSEAMYSSRLCRNCAAAGREGRSCWRSALHTRILPFPMRASKSMPSRRLVNQSSMR